MSEKIDLKKVRGVTVHEVCDYCKGARRFPGGKYKDQGEVINCPICDGRGVTPVVISLSDFRTLMTMSPLLSMAALACPAAIALL